MSLLAGLAIHSAFAGDCSSLSLKTSHQKNVKAAQVKSGNIEDFDKRIEALLEMYQSSNENFIFPLIALHGAKWANHYFEENEPIIDLLEFIPHVPLQNELKRVEVLAAGLKKINQHVFQELYAVYYTVKQNQTCPKIGAALGIEESTISAIKRSLVSRELSKKEKLQIYDAVFRFEQEYIVAPQIAKLAKQLNLSDLEHMLYLQPRVRFPYFPERVSMKFNNFFNTEERIKFGNYSAKIALDVGEDVVIDTIYQN